MDRVLLIDDDIELTNLQSEYLTEDGFEVFASVDGREAVVRAANQTVDIIVLDIMMPLLNGIDVLQRIRRVSEVPVLMLTAKGDDIDRISGLNLGADDYVAKPCSLGELSARLKAILRRAHAMKTNQSREALTVGHLVIHASNRSALWRGNMLDLTGTEFTLLEVLARHGGQLVSKHDISKQAFGTPLTPFDRRIDVHISSIRQKLGARDDGHSWIRSVRGQGYQLLQD
ncbi:response regulator transcription factor [Rhizobium bangladeshense]|uniref:response regulator transcription factor n=1 Tax=Rhizobium bangladeshense TaxID=1138189 RepID=UPI001C82E21D|nr:response regulator transcription factor [Rhizobium bangladeshense]MBX4898726.1 response regulator transcription factor [Rhizobium bangladeshense]MBY3616749.1 response regulator transcription factor [Rhizobium bangladeshense]